MQTRKGVPQRHIDARQRHAHEPLRAQQPEARTQFVGDAAWRERLANDQRLEIDHKVSDWFQGRSGVREQDPVSHKAIVSDGIDQHERRLRNDAAGGAMRFPHRDADRAGAEGSNHRQLGVIHIADPTGT